MRRSLAVMLLSVVVLLIFACSLCSAQKRPAAERPVKPAGAAREHPCCCAYYAGNWHAYLECCEKYKYCPLCPHKPWWKLGCLYKNYWYYPGDVVEINAKKCYNITCVKYSKWKWASLEVQHVDRGCDCCVYNKTVYPQETELHVGECKRIRCTKGRWEEIANLPSDMRPCPPGTYDVGDYCLVFPHRPMTFWEAVRYCYLLGGKLCWKEFFLNSTPAQASINGTAEIWLSEEEGDQPPREESRKGEKCLSVSGFEDLKQPKPVNCSFDLKPCCLIEKVPCNQTHCEVNGKKYAHGELIWQNPEDECERIECQNGYPTVVIDPGCVCLYVYKTPFGTTISRYYKPGPFNYPRWKSCKCYSNGTWFCDWTQVRPQG